jgi:UDP-N-acetyl-D-glucosamine dehydrogenase
MIGGEKLALAQFKEKIGKRRARIGVIGLGYVGLPLAIAFAKKGFSVTGIDTDRGKVEGLNRGRSHILDVPSPELRAVLRRGFFKASSDYSLLGGLDAVIVCVPTPLDRMKKPDMSFILDATASIARHLRRGQLIVLESTTYPGTTDEEVLTVLEKRTGLKAEKDFFLAFSPERVDPGNKRHGTVSIPKVVGGVGKLSTRAARALYGAIVTRIVEVSSARAAEMTKLLENTFRSVNIALVNEMARICHRLRIDIWEVIEAAKTKPFGFMPFYPGPGTGGHCIPVDPIYLSWKSRRHKLTPPMIELAAKINKTVMPQYVCQRIASLLRRRRTGLKKTPVLVLGAAYKKDVDDARESSAVDVMRCLLAEKADVTYSDPFIPSLRVERSVLRSRRLTPDVIRRQQCVVVLTDHSAVDYGMVVKHARLILDTRNVLRKYSPSKNLFFL